MSAYRPIADFYESKTDKDKAYTNYAVNRLNDYWHLKGMFMRGKSDPLYAMTDGAFHAATYNFLSNYTSINQYKFWYRLTNEQKMKLCKYFSLQEDALKTTISSDDTSAMVCVLLAGSVSTTSNLDPTEVTHSLGKVLGAVEIFNAELDDPRLADDDYQRVYERLKSGAAEQPLERPIYTALMPKGVVLRLSISGYRKAVAAGPQAELEEEEEEEEPDYSIDDGYEITEEDSRALFTRKLCRKNLPRVYYDFLRDEGMLPLLADSRGTGYIRNAPAGSALALSGRALEETLFIVITGCVRVEVDRNGSLLVEGGRLTCKSKGGRDTLFSPFLSKDEVSAIQRGVSIKRNSMPLCQLDNGGILLVAKEHFRAADASDNLQLRSSALPSLSPPKKATNRRRQEELPELYRLNLRFEKASNYLAIPYREVADAIKEKHIRGIRGTPVEGSLKALSDRLMSRMSRLEAWVGGSLDMETTIDSPSDVGEEEEEEGKGGCVVAVDSSLTPLGASLLLPKQWSQQELLQGSRRQPLGEALPAETLRLNYSMSCTTMGMEAEASLADDRSYDEKANVRGSIFATEVITDISDDMAASPPASANPNPNPNPNNPLGVIDNDSIVSDGPDLQ